MLVRALCTFIFVALIAPAAFAQEIVNCSRTEPSGERTICHETIVDAEDAWALFATSEGLSSWLAPVAAIDARVGGMMETSYNASARLGDAGNIRNRVVAIVHARVLVIQIAHAPPGFPHADLAQTLVTAIEFEAVEEQLTRVRVSMTGYGAGEGYDQLHSFFERGNAMTLEQLRRRVAHGPTDWSRAGAQ